MSSSAAYAPRYHSPVALHAAATPTDQPPPPLALQATLIARTPDPHTKALLQLVHDGHAYFEPLSNQPALRV